MVNIVRLSFKREYGLTSGASTAKSQRRQTASKWKDTLIFIRQKPKEQDSPLQV